MYKTIDLDQIDLLIDFLLLYFYPSLISLFDRFRSFEQKSKNNFVHSLGQMRTRKFASEIYWPLISTSKVASKLKNFLIAPSSSQLNIFSKFWKQRCKVDRKSIIIMNVYSWFQNCWQNSEKNLRLVIMSQISISFSYWNMR